MAADSWVAQAGVWVGLIGGVAGLSALGLTEWRSWRRRLVPPDQLWDLLLEVQRDFGTIIAMGGRDTAWFLEEERQRDRARLAAIATRIVDHRLNSIVASLRSDYDEVWVWSSAPGLRDADWIAKQVAAARRGQSSVDTAFTRMGKLSRSVA